jgi:hypothetical protein
MAPVTKRRIITLFFISITIGLPGITAQAVYITLIVTMELFLIGPFKPFISQSVLRTDKMSISHRLRDEGFERKKFFALLKRKNLG